jgi:hypothetical protein
MQFTNVICLELATLASLNQLEKLTERLIELKPLVNQGRGTWGENIEKMLAFLADRKPRFSIFAKGNGKLPFAAFSVLPLVSCPGAGACKKWCYSLKAWRYPAAFFRQLQNLILLMSSEGRETVAKAWNKLRNGAHVRLYVDGDIHSLEILEYWQNLCRQRSDLKVYGYSKSWGIFLRFEGEWASNYTLNLSSGSKFANSPRVKEQVSALPIVRGEFVAVPVASKAPKRNLKTGQPLNPAAWQAHRLEVLAAAKNLGMGKVFVCPGLCGFCANGKHACGNRAFNKIPIVIGIH